MKSKANKEKKEQPIDKKTPKKTIPFSTMMKLAVKTAPKKK